MIFHCNNLIQMFKMLSIFYPFNLINSFHIFWILLFWLFPLVYWYGTRNHSFWKQRGVKGPSVTPFLGNFFSLSEPIALFYSKHVKKYGKAFGLFQGQTPVLVLTDPVIIKRILVNDFSKFRNRMMQPSGVRHKITSQNLVAARNEEWKRIRSILTPMFTSLKLKKMEELMQHCITSMMASFEKKVSTGESIEAREAMGSYTMDVIAKCAFATDTNAHEQKNNRFLINAKSILSFNAFRIMIIFLLPRFLTQFLFNLKVKPIYVKEVDFFLDLSLHLINERRNPEKGREHSDLLQLMVNAEYNVDSLQKVYQDDFTAAVDHAHHLNNGTDELEREQQELNSIIGSKFLSTEEIMAQALVFFLAGYETTSSLLSFCLYELALNGTIQQRLYEEIQQAKAVDAELSYGTLVSKCAYLDAVISETLRKYPPALLLNRELAAEQFHIPEYGITLEKGQPVNIPVYALHHMEEFWPKPDCFDPERFVASNRDKVVPYTYMPFGAGPRNCIGMRFALTEAKMGLAHILDRYQIVRAPETTDKLELKSSLFLLKTSPIKIAVKKRS